VKITRSICLALAATVLIGPLALADNPKHNSNVNKRQQQQAERIKKGVRSGELTRKEARGIANERRDIKDVEREYRSDGTLTKRERADLDQRLDDASVDIARQKHDAQDRAPADPGVNARQENQAGRIVQGVASGELTRKEAGELVEEHRDIKQLERDYKSDGTLTGDERRDLHQQLDQAGDEIREEKHDAQQR
jgi:hypothetical protein